MGDIDMEAARALCDAATPGPWVVDADGDVVWERVASDREMDVYVATTDDRDNTEFIAAARTLVPALLDRLTAAEDRARKAEEAVQRVEAAYNLQCGHPLKRSDYVDSGAYMGHLWWQKVLEGVLRDAGALRSSDA